MNEFILNIRRETARLRDYETVKPAPKSRSQRKKGTDDGKGKGK